MNQTKNLTISGACVALGVILPITFHSIPNAGSIFLPMHIPVLLCGLICGPYYGLLCGVLAPLVSSFCTGMPPMAVLPGMLFELAAYGLLSGILIKKINVKNPAIRIYVSLIAAMICGRMLNGLLNGLIIHAGLYSMQMWITGSFITAFPGIIIQLILIPVIVLALRKAGFAVKGEAYCQTS